MTIEVTCASIGAGSSAREVLVKKRNRGEISPVEVGVWLLVVSIIGLSLSPNSEKKDLALEMEPIETAVAKAPEGCYIGVSVKESPEVVATFLNKHTEYEFVSENWGRLLLKRKSCNN